MNEDKKSGFNQIPKTIKNNMSDIRNVEHITAKEKLKWRCKCQHVDESGKAVIFRSDNKHSEYTGNPLFVCRLCGSYLDIGEITEEDLEKAMDTVCRAADIIKLRLRPNQSEDDQENYKTMWKLQFMLKSNKFSDLFRAARRRNKNNRRSSGDNGFSSSAPRSH